MSDSPRLSGMRRDYKHDPLLEDGMAGTWLEQFERWLVEAAAAGFGEANAMTLATADADGRPAGRTVLLKGVDARGFVFFTNRRSRKGRELAANPRAALVFPWLSLQRQVIVDGDAEPVSDTESDAYFASRPRGAQLGALASPQSSVIDGRAGLDAERAALETRFPEGSDVPRPEHWGGIRVVPRAVEFWQGRPDRLHDRLRYRLDAGAWRLERLAP
jgi:pyridoxamine 5'-phosphate oxidase